MSGGDGHRAGSTAINVLCVSATKLKWHQLMGACGGDGQRAGSYVSGGVKGPLSLNQHWSEGPPTHSEAATEQLHWTAAG